MASSAGSAAVHRVLTREANLKDSPELVSVINEAYLQDAFFKKKEFKLRATPENVANALNGREPDRFLVASLEGEDEEKIVGVSFIAGRPHIYAYTQRLHMLTEQATKCRQLEWSWILSRVLEPLAQFRPLLSVAV